MKRSIDRAISLLKTPADYNKYASIKIRPSVPGCCCFHCWPKTWVAINEHISPCGPLQDEGDVLIKSDDEKYVLECHESGPEIVYYIGLGTASVLLVKSVLELIAALLKYLEKDKGKTIGSIKIIRRRIINNKTNEEQIIEINLPLSETTLKNLNKQYTDVLKMDTL